MDLDDHLSNLVVEAICKAIVFVNKRFLTDDPPLALRGCITCGEHACIGNRIVGQAVDDAAEHMNAPDGAFIWLRPDVEARIERITVARERLIASASSNEISLGVQSMDEGPNPNFNDAFAPAPKSLNRIGQFKFYVLNPMVIRSFQMPTKLGNPVTCPIINPFAFFGGDVNRADIRRAYSIAMQGDLLDVVVKRQNTFRFLDAAEAVTAKFGQDLHSHHSVSN